MKMSMRASFLSLAFLLLSSFQSHALIINSDMSFDIEYPNASVSHCFSGKIILSRYYEYARSCSGFYLARTELNDAKAIALDGDSNLPHASEPANIALLMFGLSALVLTRHRVADPLTS